MSISKGDSPGAIVGTPGNRAQHGWLGVHIHDEVTVLKTVLPLVNKDERHRGSRGNHVCPLSKDSPESRHCTIPRAQVIVHGVTAYARQTNRAKPGGALVARTSPHRDGAHQ